MTGLFTAATSFSRVLAANATATAFAAAPADLTAPPDPATTPGYVALTAGRIGSPNTVLIKPYAVGADNVTGGIRVYGCRPITSQVGGVQVTSYTHTLFFEGTFQASTCVGVSGGVVGASERYADTIARTFGNDGVSDRILSPANDTPASLLVDATGATWLFVELIASGGSPATSVNALIAGV